MKPLLSLTLICLLSTANSQIFKSFNLRKFFSNDLVVTGTYNVYVQGDDFGPIVSKTILSLSHEIDSVNINSIKVKELKGRSGSIQTISKTITDAYLCTETGEKVTTPSKYITLEFRIWPYTGSPFCNGFWCKIYRLNFEIGQTITSGGQKVSKLSIEQEYTKRFSPTDAFKEYKEKYGGITYNIGAFAPENKSEKLIVWLHGSGEGGTAGADLPLLANKVTALAGEKFQTALGGCHVLVPQCPTTWMDTGGNKYLNSLAELIDDYVQKNNIKKVIISGASAGGFMVMWLAIKFPNKYLAYVPVCEALADSRISNQDIQNIKNLPIYFIYSLDDGNVKPSTHEIPTIKRLLAAGAKDVHASVTDHVIDTSGRFKDSKGNPYRYIGHASWIYFDNDDTKCNTCGISCFTWLSKLTNGY